jgi:hypothetical protein
MTNVRLLQLAQDTHIFVADPKQHYAYEWDEENDKRKGGLMCITSSKELTTSWKLGMVYEPLPNYFLSVSIILMKGER